METPHDEWHHSQQHDVLVAIDDDVAEKDLVGGGAQGHSGTGGLATGGNCSYHVAEYMASLAPVGRPLLELSALRLAAFDDSALYKAGTTGTI